eukprot:COSAG05_NODE_54_length_23549_cov_81.790840_14_plen_99_part_00
MASAVQRDLTRPRMKPVKGVHYFQESQERLRGVWWPEKADVTLGMTALCYFVIPDSPPDPATGTKLFDYCRGEISGNPPGDYIHIDFPAQVRADSADC